MTKLRPCIKLVFFNYSACIASFLLFPALIYIFTGSLVEIVPLNVPGTRMYSSTGYALNSFYHLFVLMSALGEYIYFDASFTFQMLHVFLLSNIIKNKIQEINRLVSVRKSSPALIKLEFRNLFLIHNEMLTYDQNIFFAILSYFFTYVLPFSYVDNLATIYFYPILIVIFLATVSIAINIFASFVVSIENNTCDTGSSAV